MVRWGKCIPSRQEDQMSTKFLGQRFLTDSYTPVSGLFKEGTQKATISRIIWYSSSLLIKSLPPKAIPLISPAFRCTKIAKYY